MEDNSAALAAAERERKRRAKAVGNRDLIHTGALGDTSAAPTRQKSLLGG